MGGLLHDVLLVSLLTADLLGVIALLLILVRDPAPAFGRLSLRRRAAMILLPEERAKRWGVRWEDLFERHRARAGVLPYVLLGLCLALPLPVEVGGNEIPFSFDFGPLDDPGQSEDYLGTLWQVVAAALALSIAMVAFAFEAFVSRGQQHHGGTLSEFARDTRLLAAVRLGVSALLVDGLVLLGIGHDAPRGWSALWAISLSAATLLAVPFVMGRVLRGLDFRHLLRMRRARLEKTVDQALRHQLLGQAADLFLHNEKGRLLVERAVVAPQGAVVVSADRGGEIADVRLGRLIRSATRRLRAGHPLDVKLLVGLGDTVSANGPLLSLARSVSQRDQRRLRRAIKIRVVDDPRPDRQLLEQLTMLHGQALTAIREGQEEDWRRIGELYELVLLALPRASQDLGVPFAGAVAAPGFFGMGPMQRVRDYLYDELTAALAAENRQLVDAISYLPGHVAIEAARLGAIAVAQAMLSMYPGMYYAARQRSA